MKDTGKRNCDGFLNAFIIFLLIAPVVMFWDEQASEPGPDRNVSVGQAAEVRGPARPQAGCRQGRRPVFRWLSAQTEGANDGSSAVWFAAPEDEIGFWGI